MKYRQILTSTATLARWYDDKYREMNGCWYTPPEELDRHLDDFGLIPFPDKMGLVADIGCGDGTLIRHIHVRGYRPLGTEISKVAIGCGECEEYILNLDICAEPLPDACDFIISLGSLEHVINLDAALANINASLKPEGRWYFFVPNELWPHFDQPNERTATDEEWAELFAKHGLITESTKRWNDCTALQGRKV